MWFPVAQTFKSLHQRTGNYVYLQRVTSRAFLIKVFFQIVNHPFASLSSVCWKFCNLFILFKWSIHWESEKNTRETLKSSSMWIPCKGRVYKLFNAQTFVSVPCSFMTWHNHCIEVAQFWGMWYQQSCHFLFTSRLNNWIYPTPSSLQTGWYYCTYASAWRRWRKRRCMIKIVEKGSC